MADRKQAVFKDSIHTKFMKTEGKTQTDKMIHLLGVDKKTQSRMDAIDKNIESLREDIGDIKKMLEGVIR